MSESKEAMEAIAQTDAMAGGTEYALRQCSFDPKAHLINLENDPEKKPRLYLTVEWRVYWFQLWCQENEKRFLIEEHPAEPIQGTSFLQSRCTVFIDGEPAGIGVGGFNLNGSKPVDYCVQTCLTIAKGRALANAGFGSVFSSALEGENGADVPCDAGMGTNFFVFPPQSIGPSGGNPMTGNLNATPNPSPSTQAVSSMANEAFVLPPSKFGPAFTEPTPPVRKATEIPETANAPKTRDEALKFVVPLKGAWEGHALSEVMAKDPGSVKYYATKSRNADLKKAAQLVLEKE